MDKKVLFTVLDQVADQQPNSVAIEENNRSASYGHLKNASNRIAKCLMAEGVQIGEPVGVYMECSISYLSTILGVNKAGGIFMALDIDYPIKRMEYVLHHVQPGIIVTTETYIERLINLLSELGIGNEFLKRIVILSNEERTFTLGNISKDQFVSTEVKEYSDVDVPLIVNGEDSVYLVSTSGSTGNPKMIEGCHKSLSHFIHWEVNEFGLNSHTRGCIFARPSFDLSLREMFAPLLAGGTLCIPNPEIKTQPVKLIEWLGEARITLIHPIPSIFRLVMKELKNDASLIHHVEHLDNILFAGEALFGRDLSEWRSIGGEKASLANLYGPSETTLTKIFNRIGDKEYQPNEVIPLGKPLPNTSVLIISDNLLCSENVIGEICIKTPFRSKGYFREPAMTAEKFIQNPLHNEFEDIVYTTGDLGKYLSDGTIAFAGRLDSQVKIRGNRVELSEVERAILNYPGIKQTVVLPIKKSDGDHVLTCYYLGDAYINRESLRSYLKSYLPEYMFPSFFIHLDEFPLNLNGKIDRKVLPKPEELLYDQLTYIAPSNEIEEKLAVIWSDVLGLKKVGVTNSFYELGGHSLSITKVLTRIYKEFGVELALKDIFDNSTIQKLSLLLQGKKKSTYKPIRRTAKNDFYDLSFAQKSIWIVEQKEKDLTAYNIPSAYLLFGKLNKDALSKAFDEIIKRHESLRTTFVLVNGEPKQAIQEKTNFSITFKDESQGKSGEHESVIIQKYLEAESVQTFDLEKGPLLRVLVIKLEEAKHFLLFSIHHIISDGWSRMVFINELITVYNAISSGKSGYLSELPIQYKDYAAWLNQELQGDKYDTLKAYWLNKLSGDLSLIEMPSDYDRSAERTFKGDTVYFELNSTISEGIREFNQRYGTTSFVVFLTFVKILLSKYTGKNDILIGTPIAGRDHPDIENQIGIFVNVLPIRTELDSSQNFLHYLQEVRKTVFEAYEHQLFPFDHIVQHLEVDGKHKNLSIIDVLVQSQAMTPVSVNEFSELYTKAYPVKNSTSKVDLTFDISPGDNNTSIVMIEYSTELFTIDTIREIEANLKHIINEVFADPALPLSKIRLLTTSTEQEELSDYAQTMFNV